MATLAEIAADDLRKKLRLERVFSPEIRKLFRAQADEYRRAVARSGVSPGAESYRDDWEAALRVQFRRCQKAFRQDVALASGAKSFQGWATKADLTADEEQELNDLIDEALGAWALDKSQEDADIITATTDREMREALEQARIDSENQDLPSIAALAATYLLRKMMARVPTISTTETQVGAESTKHIVSEAMSGKVPAALTSRRIKPEGAPTVYRPVGPERQATKTWVTQGDRRVRPSHVAANRQKVLNEEMFSVGGYRLRFPADGLFGAPASIICNCRCLSVYEVSP